MCASTMGREDPFVREVMVVAHELGLAAALAVAA